MDRRLIPLKDANYLTSGHLDTVIDWIPGMKNITLRDLPGIYRTTDPNDILLDFVVEQIEAASKASAIILPTFDALEHDVLNALSTMFPKLYTIGPLELLLDQTSESIFDSIKCNLWKEESECLKWLDSEEPNSVLYVNFGSVIVMRHHQLVELAWGLSNSKKKFLWVIRPDLVEGEASILPPEIVAETKGRGLLVGWCPQDQVLKHPAVAGFLTHCGWNSTLESITNGMDSDNVTRDEVEKLVKELLEGEKGKEMKKKAIEWKKMAEEATNTNGSSFLNLEKLVDGLMLFKS
ncbi:7-deoxyloganetin glucosyltransferase [Spatholobus suberectus]|nr:7-deoxyloganetin glucosyltransferase [Spatholobus suberectus]